MFVVQRFQYLAGLTRHYFGPQVTHFGGTVTPGGRCAYKDPVIGVKLYTGYSRKIGGVRIGRNGLNYYVQPAQTPGAHLHALKFVGYSATA
jgi:hypothetical protein